MGFFLRFGGFFLVEEEPIGRGESRGFMPIPGISPTPPPPPKPREWLGSLKDSVKITGDIISPVLDEKDWEVLED